MRNPSFHINKKTVLLFILVISSFFSGAQRKMETLDRGLVAVKVQEGNFLSWRIYGTEWYGVTYNIYRNGVKLNDIPLEVSNFTDSNGDLSSTYTVSAIVNGTEQEQCSPVLPQSQQYKEIALKQRNTADYQINDATAADLDGDGQYEIIVKRTCQDWSVDATQFAYFEAYKLDGTLMWEINVGPNIMSSSSVEINIAAFDFDEDGKAEVFLRTSEGTIFGDGTEIGDTDNDGKTNYRYSVLQTDNMRYMCEGPEFLSLVDGVAGAELDRVDFIPRYNAEWWGDGYGHRANKFFFGAPYLDGVHPSLFIGRGIYTKTVMRTYDVVNKKLVPRWEWKVTDANSPYYGQGNHNYTIADVDEDGRDEIVWGSMTIDDNGEGLYSTDLGHGDALHVGDLDPFRKGTEIFKCLEEAPVYGTVLYDGATGDILIHHTIDKDCGRCCAANISDDIKGNALWGGNKMFSASTLQQVGTGAGPENYRIYWDGDLLEEMTDHYDFTTNKGYGTGAIYKYTNGSAKTVLVANGATSCNYTKGTPSLQADLYGDWREEVIWRNEENTAIRIYTTTDPTPYRNYTLMHDHQYRQAICWQMCGYNQPPHVSYFLGEGEGKTVPPPPVISNNKFVYTNNGDWNTTASTWNHNGETAKYTNGANVLFDISAGDNVSLNLTEDVSPEMITVNSPGNYKINASEHKLTGNMMLVKQGLGDLKLNGKHNYTGVTKIWNGSFTFDGELQASPLYLEFFAKAYITGELGNNVTMRYASEIHLGEQDSTGYLSIAGNLTAEDGAKLSLDLYSPSNTKNDSLTINGDFTFENQITFEIIPHIVEGESKLISGKYLLASVKGEISGDIKKIQIEGISGTPFSVQFIDGNIYLVIKDVRQAGSIEWNGDKEGSEWDLAITENFLNNALSDVFVDQDMVTFNDNATSKLVFINSEVTPASITVEATADYIFQGTGKISGNTTLTKNGSGTLQILNTNEFTGKVTINEGTIEVTQMPTSQANSALGVMSNDPELLEINGGTLSITGSTNSDRALSIGENGGTLNIDNEVLWNKTITGNTLVKTGAGKLTLAAENTLTKTILKEGTITLQTDETYPGNTISLEGGTLNCADNMYSYNTSNLNFEILAEKTATINMDSRCYYTGKWTGSGTASVNIPNVRTDFNGDMSEFAGTLVFNSTYNSSTYNAELRLNTNAGLPNATVYINKKLSTSNTKGTSLILGALNGVGLLTGDETYQIGSKNEDCKFEGTISSGNLKKVGTAILTLSGSNTYTGGTTINSGTLNVENTEGSATGSGNVSVNNTGTLTGKGLIDGVINVENGGTIAPGTSSTGNKLTINNTVNLKSGSAVVVKTNPLFKLADKLEAEKININGDLVLTNVTETPYSSGNEFQLFISSQINGSFQSISPETPGENLVWDVSELNTTGKIKVVAKTAVKTIANNAISIYPNPVNEILNISLDNTSEEKANCTIFDINGKKRLEFNLTNTALHKIDVSKLPAGVYLLKTEVNSTIYNQQFIKR